MIGGLSMTELIIILGLALLLLGPDQLPQLARSLGKGLRELRKTTDDLKSQFEQEIARVDFDETPRMIAPVPSEKTGTQETPAAPPANGTSGAAAPPVVVPESDPAAARAAARRAALDAQLKLVAPEGTVARSPGGPPAAESGVVPSAAEEPKA
jgi:sec-independent protein translocase protein TatB